MKTRMGHAGRRGLGRNDTAAMYAVDEYFSRPNCSLREE